MAIHEHDVIVVGGGGAGLRAAIAAHEEGADAAIVTKLHPVRSHTGAAEGGINAALRDGDSWEDHAYDTMKGSDYLGDAPAIETLCQDSPEETIQLEHWGMPFSRDDDGRVSQRPFGGLSFPRTTYAGAETGHHMLHTMYEQVVKRGIQVYDEFYVSRLAVTDHDDRTFAVDVIGTTLERTIAGTYATGTRVNLERALRAGDRLDGHIVQGHVDGVGHLERILEDGEFWRLDVRLPGDVLRGTVLHGSITLNGVSLTVSDFVGEDAIQIGIIPFTWEHTNLGDLEPGDPLNVEGDLIGKYVGRLMAPHL